MGGNKIIIETTEKATASKKPRKKGVWSQVGIHAIASAFVAVIVLNNGHHARIVIPQPLSKARVQNINLNRTSNQNIYVGIQESGNKNSGRPSGEVEYYQRTINNSLSPQAVIPPPIQNLPSAVASTPVLTPTTVPIKIIHPPFSRRNFITSGDGTLNANVGTYTDCTGNTLLPRDNVKVDTCMDYVKYFLGHNPGFFTPLMHMRIGEKIIYYDNSGIKNTYHIVGIHDFHLVAGPPEDNALAILQTCVDPAGVTYRDFYLR